MSSLFQVLLVNLKLLSYFWATLFSQNVFELDIKFFLLLNKDILFTDFFSFCDQSLLKTLDLLNHFISFWVCAFKLSPSMDIKWLFKLIVEVFSLLLLLKIFFLEQVDLSLEIWDTCCFILGNDQLSFELSNLLPDIFNIIESLLIVNFSFL